MQAFHSPLGLSLPPGHRFPAGKYPVLRERVSRELPSVAMHEARMASDEELLRVHTPDFISSVADGSLSTAAAREIGFPWSPALAQRARYSVGATVCAAESAIVEGVAANLAGGTHHSYADHGSGYCIFNDVAVAARLLQARGPLRVAVIDLDVHQGNGTASIFQGDASVFTLSLHAERNFPFRKESSDLDVGLPDGCSDDDYLSALDEALAALWSCHAAQPFGMAFYLAGADPHEGDRLGRLKLSLDGLRERDHRVLTALRTRGIPVAISMAGGYGLQIDITVEAHLNTLREAFASWEQWKNPRP